MLVLVDQAHQFARDDHAQVTAQIPATRVFAERSRPAWLTDEQYAAHMAAYLVGLIGARSQATCCGIDLVEEVRLEPTDCGLIGGGAGDRELNVVSADVCKLLRVRSRTKAACDLAGKHCCIDGQVAIRGGCDAAQIVKGRRERDDPGESWPSLLVERCQERLLHGCGGHAPELYVGCPHPVSASTPGAEKQRATRIRTPTGSSAVAGTLAPVRFAAGHGPVVRWPRGVWRDKHAGCVRGGCAARSG